ncbi:hypothetical protein [Erythrobacter sp. R86502]|uniref:hypothetical protein n=1 Tax=Erythrobacter sp. R86502 TaxID=3093846 RepID=UPI0036D35CB2
MTHATAHQRAGHGWQLILADLALILFLLALTALPAAETASKQRLADTQARVEDAQGRIRTEVAPAQALFRPVPSGPPLREWLAAQGPDPRATLTIFTVHRRGEEAAAWTQAQALAAEARASGARVRTIISVGDQPDLYASLAYDTLIAETASHAAAS